MWYPIENVTGSGSRIPVIEELFFKDFRSFEKSEERNGTNNSMLMKF
jgi:hypothetical protein